MSPPFYHGITGFVVFVAGIVAVHANDTPRTQWATPSLTSSVSRPETIEGLDPSVQRVLQVSGSAQLLTAEEMAEIPDVVARALKRARCGAHARVRQQMSRFEHGRWNRILVWTGAASRIGKRGHSCSFRANPWRRGKYLTDRPGRRLSRSERVMPNPPVRGLIVIRYGKEQAIQVPAPPAQNLAPAVAPELTSTGS